MEIQPVVFVVDDDFSVRKSLSLLLDSHGYRVESFNGAEEFLARAPYEGVGCVVLDVNMEGINGLELQQLLIQRYSKLPIIFISGQATISMSVQALRAGAITFLEKPCSEKELIIAINEALSTSRKSIKEKKSRAKAMALLKTLSPREVDVLRLILTGMLNKQVAGELSIAEHTVKLHRHSITEKLGVKSIPEMIEIAKTAGFI
jgi:FixJ family two-component response regulator